MYSRMRCALLVRATLISTVAILLACAGPALADGLKVGIAKTTITPAEPGQYLAGYGANRPAEGVHDDIWCRAIAIDDGDDTIVIVSLDLLGLMFPDAREIADSVQGVPPENVIVCCTHVHSAPDVIGLWGPNPQTSGVDPEFLAMVKRRTIRTINRAIDDAVMQPAKLRFATCTAPPRTGYNDRERDLIDPEITIMQAVTPDGDPITTLVNYACHPEVLTTESRLVTSDFVHFLRDEMETAGTGDVVFVNGALGGMVTPEVSANTFDEAERVGRALGATVNDAIERAEEFADVDVSLSRTLVELPFANPQLELAANAGVIDRQPAQDGTIDTTVIAGRIGPAGFVTMPGEALPKVGLAAKDLLDTDYKFFFGLADDELGYLLHAEAIDAELYDYEQSMSVNKNAVPALMDALKATIDALD